MRRFVVEALGDAFGGVALCDTALGSRAELAPGRGGMLTRLLVDGDEVFYLDKESLRDTSRNVRGGNPVLFPTPGKLTGDTWARKRRTGTLKQHGFARLLPWTVVATGTDDGAWARLRLDSTDETHKDWPWRCRAEFTYRLRGDTVRIEIDVTNKGKKPMPFGVGFHPYFLVPQAQKAATIIGSTASKALDNRTGVTAEFYGFDLDSDEVDMHLIDHQTEWAVLRRPDRDRAVLVEGSEAFTHWVVWTLKDRDFVCVEPWTCPGDAMNSGDRLLTCRPGERSQHWIHIAYR